ncbi:hypothetical protein F5887DRAFT_947214 [Amanita rubescens]|nr:hypothetical protein F5887DRAFT_947214 [Amanita rubescens]
MSRRRSADHARVKRISKALEEREPKHTKPALLSPLQVASQLPGPIIIPNLQTPTTSATPPSPTSGSGGSGSGNGGGSSSGQGSGNSGGNGSGGGGSSGNGGGSSTGGGDSGIAPTNSSGASNPGSGGGSSISPTSTPAPGPAGATDASQSTGDSASSSLPGVANAGSGSSTTLFIQDSATSTLPNGVPAAMSTQGRSSVATGTGNSGGENNGTDGHSISTLSRSHGLSSGGIAGIVITLLIVGLATLVVMLRRRAIARRVKRRQQWYGQGIASTTPHGDNGSSRFGSIASRKTGTAAGTRSARSSFATTFDQSPHIPNFDGLLPPMPPMAEIRGEGLILGLDMNSYTTNTNSKRDSAGSKNSTASDPNAQYLFLPPISQGNRAIGSPMSVRPFSPSELYSFPRPPSEANRKSEDRVSAFSQLHNNGHGGQVDDIRLSDAAEHPSVVEGVDPFADPIAATVATQPAVAEIEVIRRPFMPTLQDELIVATGDRVRILQTFDDGWTLVQKIPPPVDKKGKARAVDEFDQGLIPIECLRNADRDQPDFIAQKRVSSAGDLDANIARAL